MADEQNTTTEQQESENRLIAERRAKLADLREAGNAFPNHFRRDFLAADLQAQYGEVSKEELAEKNIQVAVAGRMMLDRKAFKVLQDMSGRIQIYASKDVQKDTKHWDLGDIVGVKGTLCKSGKGDLYVMMDEYLLLTKSLRPLPEKHKGLTDNGQRAANSIYEIFEQEFSDPKDRYYSLSMDILQEMMSITQQGMGYDIIVQPNPEGGQHRFNHPAQLENYVFKQATNLVAASFAESSDLVHFEGT